MILRNSNIKTLGTTIGRDTPGQGYQPTTSAAFGERDDKYLFFTGHQKSAKLKSKTRSDRNFKAMRQHGVRSCNQRRNGTPLDLMGGVAKKKDGTPYYDHHITESLSQTATLNHSATVLTITCAGSFSVSTTNWNIRGPLLSISAMGINFHVVE